MLAYGIGRTIRFFVLLCSALLMSGCAQQAEIEPLDLLGWLEDTFEFGDDGTTGEPVSCSAGAECQGTVAAREVEDCEQAGNLNIGGPKIRAFQLGRFANCFERSGQVQLASAYREKQRVLHREYGSVLYPVSYYQGKIDESGLLQVSARDTAESCIQETERFQFRLCKDCTYPMVYRNNCSISVHFAYCIRRGGLSTSLRECHEYSTAKPGEMIVVLGRGEEFVERFRSFRTNSEQQEWIRQQVGRL